MSNPVKTVPERLRAAADLFEERNRQYGSNYKRFGAAAAAMFPQGVLLEDDETWTRFILFAMNVVKITRYASNMAQGRGHTDSMDDLAVYSMMINETDEEARLQAEPPDNDNNCGCNSGHPTVKSAEDAIPTDTPMDPVFRSETDEWRGTGGTRNASEIEQLRSDIYSAMAGRFGIPRDKVKKAAMLVNYCAPLSSIHEAVGVDMSLDRLGWLVDALRRVGHPAP